MVATDPVGSASTGPVGFEAGRILKGGGSADSAPLSRILAELLGGTRSSPPEAPSRRDRLGNDERANLQFSI